ncbi:MAG TPA: hypothetical protein VGH87_02870 [Polyangiaceae bacterium]|jgi:hypothetical protein
MAPVAPLGRDAAIELVLTGKLPIWFGSPHPHTAIVEQDGVFRIRELVVDPAEADASQKAAFAKHESWMPEHYYALGKATGAIHVEAKTRDELVQKMKTMAWPGDW